MRRHSTTRRAIQITLLVLLVVALVFLPFAARRHHRHHGRLVAALAPAILIWLLLLPPIAEPRALPESRFNAPCRIAWRRCYPARPPTCA